MAVNFQDAITITRYNAGVYTNGEWVPAGTPSASVAVTGNIQGASSKDRELIAREFGQSVDGLICLRTNEALYTVAKSPARVADRLTWQGSTYEVIRTEYRGTIVAVAHHKSHARLVDGNAEDGGL